jgi:predicted outer membrane repeat protein
MKINTLLLVMLVVGLSALALPVPVHAASGPRCYVNDDATGSNNGNSWADAYTSLQAALADSNCTEIWVAAGVYYPDNTLYADNDRSATFTLKNGVEIYGGFAGTETLLSQRNWRGNRTILSGDIDQNDTNTDGNYIAENTTHIQGANAYHVVTGSGTNNTAVLDGFIITAGQADDYANWPNERGGGMLNLGGSPTLSNLIFSGNFAVFYGGGMTNYNSSSPILTNVTFSGNSATSGSGGGMFNANLSSPTLTNVTFSGNSASSGGGMRNENNSNPTLTNVTFSGNSATNGGGMYNYSSSPTLTNVTFSGNSASNNGGGIHNFGSKPYLINVIIWGSTSGGSIHSIHNESSSNPRITHSDIEGCGYTGYWFSDCGWDDNGNIQGDPLFVDANGADDILGTPDDNLRLGFGSPAIDKGAGSGCPTTDLDNLPRPTDGDANGTATCDMGAYEAGTMICSVGFGFYQFPHQSNVIIEVSIKGNLACLYVDEMGLDHPNATAGIKTGRYWLIRALQSDKTTPATFYIVHLTLPTTFTPDANSKVCRYTGSGTVWDCAMSSYTSNAITRYGITELSDWAVGNNVGPTAVRLKSLTAVAAPAKILPLLGVAALLVLAFFVVYSKKF